MKKSMLKPCLLLMILASVAPISHVLGQAAPTLSVDSPSFNEDAGSGFFTVMLSAPAVADTSVLFILTDVTATAFQDYTLPNGSVTFPTGTNSVTVPFDITDDIDAEWDETFTITLTLGDDQTSGTATIIDNDGIPVNAPSALTAAAHYFTEINLTWVNNHTNATENQVERSPNGISNWQIIANLAPDAVEYLDDDAECSQTYYYRVRAYGTFVYSDYSNTATASTDVCSLPRVSPQPNYYTTNAVTLTWNPITGADSYDFQIADNAAFANVTTVTGINALSYAPTGLENHVYYWRVRAVVVGNAGFWGEREIFIVDVPGA